MQTLFVAARQFSAIIILVVALFTGLTVAIWMLPLGIITYVVVVVLATRDPQLATHVQRTTRRTRLSSKTFQALMQKIMAAQHDVERSIAAAQGPLIRLLQPIADQTTMLVDQAHMLAQKGEIIETYLNDINLQQLDANIVEIQQNITHTTDSYTLQQLTEAHTALIASQRHAHDLQTFNERIIAQLENITANMGSVLAETVRLRTADAVSIDSSSNQVAEQLRNLNADMSAFCSVLDTAIEHSTISAPTIPLP